MVCFQLLVEPTGWYLTLVVSVQGGKAAEMEVFIVG